MIVDPSAVIACAAEWRPHAGWAETLRAPYEALVAGATGAAAAQAWATVAMVMGDSRAAPLALIVCLHAGADDPDRRVAPHRDLCLLDLGLASAPGPVRLGDLGQPGTVDDRPGDLAAWTIRALVPFDQDLARAAWFALRIAAYRTGLISELPLPTDR